MSSREAFEKWVNGSNPMMAKFLIENLAFFECYEEGSASRQTEIDALQEEVGLCHGTLESRDRNVATLMEENAALKARLEPFERWPNIDALRQCMVDAADEIQKLKAEAGRMSERGSV